MKPAATITLVVVAVLTTVVIEEIRIKKLQAEVLRLGRLPTDQPINMTPEDILARETPLPGRPPEPAPPLDPAPEPTPDPVTPPTPEPAPEPMTPGMRNVPESFPEPTDERVKEAALSPYSDLHYQLGLTNRERVYLDELLAERLLKQQELAQAWIEASGEARGEVEQQMGRHLDESDQTLRTFFKREEDYETFATYHSMQPERLMVGQLIPLMDQEGISLELEKEHQLVAAMHQARVDASGIDWNSAEALQAVVAGDAKSRFEKEWAARTESLRTSLPEFLDEKTMAVIMASREKLKATTLEALDSAIETISGVEAAPEAP
jgi:hypothetical protein